MKTTILKMTDAYDYQNFYSDDCGLIIKDFRHLEGTKCYLDDASKETLREAFKDLPLDGIHFIDSGNYHYLSLLYLEKINTDFNLVLFDHHPDNQPPSFGDITSCGGWVLEATQNLKHLKNVYTFGVGEDPAFSSIPTDLPLYISIDKDILSEADSITDWDQGDMSLNKLIQTLLPIIRGRQIIGVDICGDSGEKAADAGQQNNQTNAFLFDFFSQNL